MIQFRSLPIMKPVTQCRWIARHISGALIVLILTALAPISLVAEQVDMARNALVRVSVTSQIPDYRTPWNPGSTQSGRGAGFVIDGQRVLTNAHVVANARFITLEKEGDPNSYTARVQHVAHDCDLAIVVPDDAKFFEGTRPLELGGIPPLQSSVSAYGYPIGGDRLSVTEGIVSRIDFQPYSHSGIDSHLTIQIDAAINPGNSGGPVLANGKVVGVAFQGFSGDVAQNVGYMIPTPVVRRFLKDIEDGRYDHYVDLSISTFALLNPAQRRALGLGDDLADRGVMVSQVTPKGSSDGHLRVGDVLLEIEGKPIAKDGMVNIEGELVDLAEIVERKHLGETIRFEVLREGRRMDVAFPLKTAEPFKMLANQYDIHPRYILFGGLLFQPLSRNLANAYNIKDLRISYHLNQFISEEFHVERPEIVLLTAVLSDPVNAYLDNFPPAIVDTINGQHIGSLEEAAAAFDKDVPFHVIKLLGSQRPLVLSAEAVREAQPRIAQRYKITQDRRLDETTQN